MGFLQDPLFAFKNSHFFYESEQIYNAYLRIYHILNFRLDRNMCAGGREKFAAYFYILILQNIHFKYFLILTNFHVVLASLLYVFHLNLIK